MRRPAVELVSQCRNYGRWFPRGSPERALLIESADMMEELMRATVSVEAVELALGRKEDGSQRRLAPWQVEALGGRNGGV